MEYDCNHSLDNYDYGLCLLDYGVDKLTVDTSGGISCLLIGCLAVDTSDDNPCLLIG